MPRFDVFVSYNTADRVAVERIARALERRGLAVFIDRWELLPGQPWPQALERCLDECRSAAVVLGASGVGTWQHREQFLALDRQARDDRFSVIPVLLPDADPPLGFLGLNTWVDLRDGVDDPQAIDLLAAAVSGQPPSALREASQRTSAGVCPYRGLAPFREEDAPFYFGREAFVARLLEQVGTRELVAVVGASGSGKSSVVRAGLVPSLRRGSGGVNWDIVTLVPGEEPLAALARSFDPPPEHEPIAARVHVNAAAARLRDGDVSLRELGADQLARQPGTDRMLLVVDQFEELSTLAADGEDASRFVDLLLDATRRASALTVLITLRSDFYTQIVQRRDLNDRLQDAVVHIGPLSPLARGDGPSELESIIRRPADAAGLAFEDGLVARIVADAGSGPGNLPLLEFLLAELWQQRAGKLLTHRAYDTLGGVQGAIAKRADDAYASLAPAQRRAARRLFLSLIRPGEDREDTRVPAPFPADPEQAEVARRFSGADVRLLVTDEDALRGRVVQLSHEALIRNWSRLRRWIDRHRDTLRARERVRERMRRWREREGPTDLLLPPGLELEEGRRLLELDTDVAIDEVRGYIEASIAADASRRRRKIAWASALATAGLLLLALTTWQWREATSARELAQENAVRAESERDLAIAQRVAATGAKVLDENPGETALAGMLAVESQARRSTPEANALLREVLRLTPLDRPLLGTPWVDADILFSADGRVQAISNRDVWTGPWRETVARSSVTLLEGTDLSTSSARRFAGHVDPLISPDGRWMVGSGFGRRLVITDLASGETVVDTPTRSAGFAVFSPDAGTLYVARQTGEIEVRTAPEWSASKTLAFPVDGARRVELQVGVAADGSRLFVVDRERGAYLVPVDGSPATRLALDVDELLPRIAANYLSSGLVSPAGRFAATRQARGKTRLWDLATGREHLAFEDAGRPTAQAFSPDGSTIATASSDGLVIVRAVGNGAELHRWRHSGDETSDEDRILALAFPDDGQAVASAGEDGTISIRNLNDGELRHRLRLGAPVLALAVDPFDGSLLAGCGDGTLARFHPDSGALIAKRKFDGAVATIATGGPRRTIAVGIHETRSRSYWEDIRFVDRASEQELSHVGFDGALDSKRISPDGRLFAAFSAALGRVLVWNTADGEKLHEFASRAAPLGFSPDARRLLVHSGSGPLAVVDLGTGRTMSELGEPGGVRAAFARPYRDHAITLGDDGSLRGWDLASGTSRWHTAPDRGPARVTTSAEGAAFAWYSEGDRAVHVFESASGQRIGTVPVPRPSWFLLSDDGKRMLTVRRSTASDSDGQHAHQFDLWDVPEARRIRQHRIEARGVGTESFGDDFLALRGTSTRGGLPATWLEMIDWRTGDRAWSLTAQHGAPWLVKHVDRDRGRVLVQGPTAREMRSLSDGTLLWKESGTSLRAAAPVAGGAQIALADATSLDSAKDVIRLVSGETGRERLRIVAGGHARDVAATSDGTRVVAAISSPRWRGLRVWRTSDGRLVREIELDANPRSVVPLRDPEHVAVSDFARNLRVLDLTTGEPRVRIAHARSAATVAVARETDRAVTVAGASLRAWDTRTGRQIAHRVSHGDASSVVLSPDGTRVAYLTRRPRPTQDGAEYRAVVIWSPGSAAPPSILPVEDVDRIAFDPSGRYLAMRESEAGRGARVRVIDAGTLRTVRILQALRNGSIGEFSWRADGDVLLVRETGRYQGVHSTERHALRAIEIGTGIELARIDMGRGMLAVPATPEVVYQDPNRRWRRVDFSHTGLDPRLFEAEPDRLVCAPESALVLATSYWKRTLVHDTATAHTRVLTTGDEPFNVLHAAVDRGGGHVALSLRERDWRQDSRGEVVVVDAVRGAELARTKLDRYFWQVEFVDGGDALLMSELRGHLPKEPDRKLVHWNWRTGVLRTLVHDNPVPYFAVSRDGARFATAEGSRHTDTDAERTVGTRQLRIWRGTDGAELVRRPLAFDPSGIALSPDGRHVAVRDLGQVLLVRADDGADLAHFRVNAMARVTEQRFAIATESRTITGSRTVAFAADGQTLVITEARDVLLFDIAQRRTRRLRGTEPLERTVVSTDGAHLATLDARFVSVWEVATGELLIRTEMPGVRHLAFGGPGGQELFASRGDGIHRLRWQPEALKSLACESFAQGDWRRGRLRVIQTTNRHPCETDASGASVSERGADSRAASGSQTAKGDK